MPELIQDFWPLVILPLAFILIKISRRPERGIFLAFLTSGILLTPNLPIIRDKVTATEFVFLMVWFALLINHGKRNRDLPLQRNQKISLLLGGVFIMWAVISFGLNNMVYTRAFIPSMIETINMVYGYMMFLTTVFLLRDWERWEKALNWWVAGSVVVVFFGVWAMIGGAPSWTYEEFTHRISSTLRNENQVPSYLLPIFVCMIFMAIKKRISLRKQLFFWVLIASTMLTSVGTGSRTALVMLVVSALGVFYVAYRVRRRRAYSRHSLINISLSLAAGLVVYVSVALVNYDGNYRLGHTPSWQRPVVMFYDWGQGNKDFDTNRQEQLIAVTEHAGDNLLIGTGPKIYGLQFGIAEIHNTYAGVLLQTGLIGFLLFMLWLAHIMWLALTSFRKIGEPYQRLMVLSLIVGMFTLLLYGMTMYGLRQRTIWLLSGLLVASSSLIESRRARTFEGSLKANDGNVQSTVNGSRY